MRQRNSFHPTGLRERAWIVWLWVEGWSVRFIAQHTGTSVTTVYRWIRRWEREGNVETRNMSGRPRSSPWIRKMGNKLGSHTCISSNKSSTLNSHPNDITLRFQSTQEDCLATFSNLADFSRHHHKSTELASQAAFVLL